MVPSVTYTRRLSGVIGRCSGCSPTRARGPAHAAVDRHAVEAPLNRCRPGNHRVPIEGDVERAGVRADVDGGSAAVDRHAAQAVAGERRAGNRADHEARADGIRCASSRPSDGNGVEVEQRPRPDRPVDDALPSGSPRSCGRLAPDRGGSASCSGASVAPAGGTRGRPGATERQRPQVRILHRRILQETGPARV